MSDGRALLSLLSDRPVAYHPDIARIVGGVKAAVFLCQLLYWTGKGNRSDGYIWKTQSEIESETALTRTEQESARRKLRQLGVLDEMRTGPRGKLHYRVNTENLVALIDSYYSRNDHPQNTPQNAENPQSDAGQNAENLQSDAGQNAENLQSDAGQNAENLHSISESTSTESTSTESTVSTPGDDESTRREMFAAIAKLCQIDLTLITQTDRGKLNRVTKQLLDAGKTPAHIPQFARYWYAADWRGRRGQPPDPWDIPRNWARARVWLRKQREEKTHNEHNKIEQQQAAVAAAIVERPPAPGPGA